VLVVVVVAVHSIPGGETALEVGLGLGLGIWGMEVELELRLIVVATLDEVVGSPVGRVAGDDGP
jgi:hypothetical protein